MKRIIFVTISLAISIFSFANVEQTEKGVEVGHINNVEVRGGKFHIDIQMGNFREQTCVIAEGNQSLDELVKWKAEDRTLILTPRVKDQTITLRINNFNIPTNLKATNGAELTFRSLDCLAQISFIADRKSSLKYQGTLKSSHIACIKALNGSNIEIAAESNYIVAYADSRSRIDLEGYMEYLKCEANNKSEIFGKGNCKTIFATADRSSKCDLRHIDAKDVFANSLNRSFVTVQSSGDVIPYMSNGSNVTFFDPSATNILSRSGTWLVEKNFNPRNQHEVGNKMCVDRHPKNSEAAAVYNLKGKVRTARQVTYEAKDVNGEIKLGKIVLGYGPGLIVGKVRFATFDKHGNVILRTRFSGMPTENAAVQMYDMYSYKYNKQGDVEQRIEKIHSDSTKERTVKIDNIYDNEGRLEKQIQWLDNGNLKGYTKTYSPQGELLEIFYEPNKSKTNDSEVNWSLTYSYKYDELGYLIEEKVDDKENPFLNRNTTYKYENGKLKEKAYSSGIRIEYSYDENRSFTETCYNNKGEVTQIDIYTLEEFGNWTEKLTKKYVNGIEQLTLTVQEIEYY